MHSCTLCAFIYTFPLHFHNLQPSQSLDLQCSVCWCGHKELWHAAGRQHQKNTITTWPKTSNFNDIKETPSYYRASRLLLFFSLVSLGVNKTLLESRFWSTPTGSVPPTSFFLPSFLPSYLPRWHVKCDVFILYTTFIENDPFSENSTSLPHTIIIISSSSSSTTNSSQNEILFRYTSCCMSAGMILMNLCVLSLVSVYVLFLLFIERPLLTLLNAPISLIIKNPTRLRAPHRLCRRYYLLNLSIHPSTNNISSSSVPQSFYSACLSLIHATQKNSDS